MDEAPHTKQVGMLRALRFLWEIPLTAKSAGISLAFAAVLRPVYARTSGDFESYTLHYPSSLSLELSERTRIKNPLEKSARTNTWHPPSPPGFYNGAGPVDSRMINRAGISTFWRGRLGSWMRANSNLTASRPPLTTSLELVVKRGTR